MSFSCIGKQKSLGLFSTTFEYFNTDNTNNMSVMSSINIIYNNCNFGVSYGIVFPLGMIANLNGGYCFQQKNNIYKFNFFAEIVDIVDKEEYSSIGAKISTIFKIKTNTMYPAFVEPYIQCGVSNIKKNMYIGCGLTIGTFL